MIQKIAGYLRFRIYEQLEKYFRPVRYPVIFNANGAIESNKSKRALLIYIVRPFLVDENDPVFYAHQHWRQCKQIAAILREYGFIVDVVDIGDKIFKATRDYDLVICNRGVDTPLNEDVMRIYLATTLSHDVHNRNLLKRHKLLSDRRGCRVLLRRSYSEVMPYIERSDAITGFGNEFILNTWREGFKVPTYPFNNYGFKETEFLLDSKDFSTARKNFLFFASKSQMQKGLDLLLEIFPKHPDLHLYICSDYEKEKDFCACYHKELYETTNIHPIGKVRVNGPEYTDLVRKCAFVIAPSCSEGQSGSVVQCMYSGLIPLVTKEVGVDTEEFGITFADDSLEEIKRVMIEVSEMPESWHRERSIRTRNVSEEKYSENAFIERWRNMLAEILHSAGDKVNS